MKKVISDDELAERLKWLPAAQDLAKMLGETKPSALETLCRMLSHTNGDLGWLVEATRDAIDRKRPETFRKDTGLRTKGGVFFEVAHRSGKFPKKILGS